MILEDSECVAILTSPTLLCRIFGCKVGDDPTYHLDTLCWCGRDAYVVGPEGYGIVHADCCKRCGQPIVPTARIVRK